MMRSTLASLPNAEPLIHRARKSLRIPTTSTVSAATRPRCESQRGRRRPLFGGFRPISRIRSHRLDETREFATHLLRFEMDPVAVAGEDPLEALREQGLHGTRLLAPVVPAHSARGPQALAVAAPPHVIAGEEELLSIEERGVSGRVAGDGDRDEVRTEGDGIAAVEDDLRAWRGVDLGPVDHTLRTELLRPTRRVGDVVPVAEEDARDAAALLETLLEVPRIARRIDEPVPVRVLDEVARRAEGVRRSEAAVGDAVLDRKREFGDRILHAAARRRRSGGAIDPDRSRGTGDKRPH